MDKQTKQRLIIGGTIIATLIILFLLFRGRSPISTVKAIDRSDMPGNINMPGLDAIGWNDFPPLIYTPPDISGFDWGLDYTPNNLNGGLGLTNNMPTEHTGKPCIPSAQPPLVIYGGGGGGMSLFNNSGAASVPQYIPFMTGR